MTNIGIGTVEMNLKCHGVERIAGEEEKMLSVVVV
jgi:hypothetical protein